ncbi:signal transduction histidine kinase/PAS domain-containing protein/ActR/RegA family two-component response regulator [Aequitasia blattaphilus]|uniref:Stage 0 sporulation protein A homolog n=1 Tax=Aequitasia blattaphilus TaxID=2949332 RepID=A0ABT1EAE6_9FIRM|nr:ATP-binding protein [Aequitasia blattaphilus]MCP1102777.1 response regulator [Aequitasia blattaphilus]MCR8615417.1 response regulator [Aequitasia blattaphilus]
MSVRERGKTEVPLQVSDEIEEFFRKVDIQVMISDLDTDVILYANDKMNEAYGVDYNPKGMRCWEVYQTGQEGRCTDCPLNMIRQDEGETIEWERMNPAKDRWFRNTSSLVSIGDGRFVHFEQGTDITDTKNANRAQQESEAYAQLMLDSTPLICSIWDESGNMIDCNMAALDYFEIEDKSTYINCFQELNPEFQPNGIPTEELAQTYIKNTLQTGYQCFFWQYQTRNGEELPVETTLIRVPWHGEYRILAYSQDLRQIKKAEATVEKYNNLLRLANDVAAELLAASVENFDSLIVQQLEALGEALGADRVCIWKNVMREETLYYHHLFWWGKMSENHKRNVSLGKELAYDSLPAIKIPLYSNQPVNHLVREMPPVEREFFANKGIKASLMLPLVIQEKFWGFISFENCLDETPATDVEISVLRSSANMLVSAIIQNETNKMLAIATKDALANVRAKDEFMARMSHELRTPMNAVINMTEVARQEDDLDKIKDALAMASDSAKQLLTMLNDILDMSNIDMDELTVKNQPYGIWKMVDDIVSTFSLRAEKKHQNFQHTLKCEPGRIVVGDREKTVKILSNLLSNAIKFTPEQGEIKLLVSEDILEENCGVLMIEVVDNGVGMDENFVSHAFDLFEQEDGGRSRAHAGIGLGLAITKNLIDLMGGTITVESKLGEGSRFFVKLPFTYEANRPKDTLKWPDKKVLLVEDMPVNQMVAMALMKKTDVTIDCAENGQEALEMFKSAPERYDMILMDLQMPVMDGVETARRIRASGLPRAKEIPIYAVTANAYKEDIEVCRQAEMNGHISKPIDGEALYQAMEEAFKKTGKR